MLRESEQRVRERDSICKASYCRWRSATWPHRRTAAAAPAWAADRHRVAPPIASAAERESLAAATGTDGICSYRWYPSRPRDCPRRRCKSMNWDVRARGMRSPQFAQLASEREREWERGRALDWVATVWQALTVHTIGAPALARLGVLLAKEIQVDEAIILAVHLECILQLLVTLQWHVFRHLVAAPHGTFSRLLCDPAISRCAISSVSIVISLIGVLWSCYRLQIGSASTRIVIK